MRLSARLESQIAGQSQHRPLNHLATATGGLTQPLAVNRRGLSERCRNGSAEAQSSLNQPEFCPEGGEHLIRPTGAASISDVRPTAHIPTGALGRVLGRLSPAIANPPRGSHRPWRLLGALCGAVGTFQSHHSSAPPIRCRPWHVSLAKPHASLTSYSAWRMLLLTCVQWGLCDLAHASSRGAGWRACRTSPRDAPRPAIFATASPSPRHGSRQRDSHTIQLCRRASSNELRFRRAGDTAAPSPTVPPAKFRRDRQWRESGNSPSSQARIASLRSSLSGSMSPSQSPCPANCALRRAALRNAASATPLTRPRLRGFASKAMPRLFFRPGSTGSSF